MSINKKQVVVDLLKSIETGDAEPAKHINPAKYIQHNLAVGDGIEGLSTVLSSLPKGSARVNTVRAFQDGDFVFTHTEYNFFGPKIGFDIFRFENDKIVEHWDNLQETPENVNPSGRSMIDGDTSVGDIEITSKNKELVKKFVEDILIGGKLDQISMYIDSDNYKQHNPNIADGLTGLSEAFKALAEAGIEIKFEKLHYIFGEGNFVLTASEGKFGANSCAYYDLFRVKNEKIVEHWDTIESIPPRNQWKNSNGKF